MTEKTTRQRCPECYEWLDVPKTDWVLQERTTNQHKVACIGNPEHAPSAAAFQIHANLAAYHLEYDATINLGFRGTAWVRCPRIREIGTICLEN
jgi:hypothetical protein